MKQTLSTLLLLSAACGLMACGGGGSAPVTVAPPPVTPPPPPPPPPVSNDAPTTISVAAPGSIVLNQVGFTPKGKKTAIVHSDQATPLTFQLLNEKGIPLMSGDTVPFGLDPVSGKNVHKVDFTAFDITGVEYVLEIDGKRSPEFEVEQTIYNELIADTTATFYQSRAGVLIESQYVPTTSPRLNRAAGHSPEIATCFSGQDANGVTWPGCTYQLDVTGGWYDAGDYGKYTTNTGMAVWNLQNIYERRLQRQSDHIVADGTRDFPENGNAVPDTLDEARIGIELMLNMQAPIGSTASVALGAQPVSGPTVISEIDVSGMAHHKVHSQNFSPLPGRPRDDVSTRFLYPPSTAATLSVAAIGAQCARLWKTIDPAFSDTCLNAAKTAFDAAERVPDAFAYDNFEGGGPYDDQDLSDEYYWAATELFITTGDTRYQNALIANRSAVGVHIPTEDTFTMNVEYLGLMSLALQPSGSAGLNTEKANAETSLVNVSERFASLITETGYAIPNDATAYYAGSNSTRLNRAYVMAYGYDISARPEFLDGVHDTLGYVLGRNPLNQSFVTGYGTNAVKNPHHRFWGHAIDTNFPKPPAGLLSGGPNDQDFPEAISQGIRSTCAGPTCWVDNPLAYSVNEVAINWNASLLWVTSYVSDNPG